jgi:ABC-type glycerol-3-phosphate transport system permease component
MNMVVTRIFYQSSIPEELYEAARVDGCGEFGQFFKIAIPLSAPIIAVMSLFYAVARWNDYFHALIFVSNRDFFPLQLVLRNILIAGQMALQSIAMGRNVEADEVLAMTRLAYMAEAMKYALIFIASAPLLIAYPFVQKYFVKGVMIGSLKG